MLAEYNVPLKYSPLNLADLVALIAKYSTEDETAKELGTLNERQMSNTANS